MNRTVAGSDDGPFPAYYEQDCDYCDQPIYPGDYVVTDTEGRFVHQEHARWLVEG